MTHYLPVKLRKSVAHFSKDEQGLIARAFLFARQKHRGQKRRSGSPYISHPVAIAVDLAEGGAETHVIAAGLLHDVLEDTETEVKELEAQFGREVASIVNGVTKVSSIKIPDKRKVFSKLDFYLASTDNYRKILMATAKDPRVMIVKLYDRLDNCRTMEQVPDSKRKFYARETIEIFAPIAERLGMGNLKGRLEDQSFPFAYPEEFIEFKKKIKNIYRQPELTVRQNMPLIKELLFRHGLSGFTLSGRAKFLYSLYKKLKRKENIHQIFDIAALRIMVKSVPDCYSALGLIHSAYEPLPNQIDDYIAKPKDNDYQSIHTTVSDRQGRVFEIQIRTKAMHDFAENGLASHWHYKEKRQGKAVSKSALEWIKELEKLQKITDKEGFLAELKDQIFSDKVFVFTPKGDIIRLPSDATPIDFAYHIHGDVGNHCFGAKINGRIMPLDTTLNMADTVEIITAKNAYPREGWLKITKTVQAKQRIRSYLREKQESFLFRRGWQKLKGLASKFNLPKVSENEAEKSLSRSRLPYKSLKKAVVSLAENSLAGIRILKALYPGFRTTEQKRDKKPAGNKLEISALKGIRHEFAKCCQPKISDRLVGYPTKEHTIKIHKQGCKMIRNADPRRLIEL